VERFNRRLHRHKLGDATNATTVTEQSETVNTPENESIAHQSNEAENGANDVKPCQQCDEYKSHILSMEIEIQSLRQEKYSMQTKF
jgi:hypothetical protein